MGVIVSGVISAASVGLIVFFVIKFAIDTFGPIKKKSAGR